MREIQNEFIHFYLFNFAKRAYPGSVLPVYHIRRAGCIFHKIVSHYFSDDMQPAFIQVILGYLQALSRVKFESDRHTVSDPYGFAVYCSGSKFRKRLQYAYGFGIQFGIDRYYYLYIRDGTVRVDNEHT